MRSRAAVLAVCLVAVLPTAGCYQGFDNTVNTQSATGNGTDFQVGDLLVQDATLVADEADTGVASLSVTITNDGVVDESLESVTAELGGPGKISGDLAVPAGTSLAIGAPGGATITFTGLQARAGQYATLTFAFSSSGSVSKSIAVVPPDGYYTDYAPAAVTADER